MITIKYDATKGDAIADGNAEEYVEKLLDAHYIGGSIGATVGSELVISYLRVAIVEKKITPNDVTLYFGDEILSISNEGMIRYWPKGFCDRYEDALSRILDWG
jgi:hypothetical protein